MRCRFSLVLVTAVLVLAGSTLAQDVQTGSADLTKFVALGDGPVAGLCNGSLYEQFQIHSIPALIYKQLHGGNVEGFEQPLIGESGRPARLVLGSSGVPVRLPVVGIPTNGDLDRAYDNLGMMGGARVRHLTTVTGDNDACREGMDPPPWSCQNLNLTLRDRGTAVDQARSLEPTFALLWVGSGDMDIAVVTGKLEYLTASDEFDRSYREIVRGLNAGGSIDMVLATLPDFTMKPDMTTIPWFLINYQTMQPILVDGDLVPLIGPGDVPTAPGDFVHVKLERLRDGCGVPPELDDAAGVIRDPERCPAGAPYPWVLKAANAEIILDTAERYNDSIRDVAREYDYALFDAAAFHDDLARNGVSMGGIRYTTEYLRGGLYSYDAIYPAPVMSALLANGFIGAINDRYGADIPEVDLFPYVFGPDGNLSPPVPPISFPSRGEADRLRRSRDDAREPRKASPRVGERTERVRRE